MRLVVVSNRLPVTIEKKNKKLNIKESAGGLVSGLSSYLQSLHGPNLEPVSEYLWIGWPGLEVDEQYQSEIKERLLSQYNSFPIYLSEDVMENFYQGFCNKTIWPLFHYFPSFADYKEEYWNSYQQVNKQFFYQIIELLKPDDYLWIHDYHLMLLPKLIREKMPNIKIGFFLHIPFPTYEVYSLLPSKWRIEILEGLLGADVIGFHIHDYTQYFLRCVLRIIGLDSDLGRIYLKNRLINVNTFPMGIDYDKFQSALSSEGHKQEKIKLKQSLSYEKIILSIDRLDYTKGILNRLFAYELFLDNNPDWKNKIKLILQIIPSRIGVDKYGRLKKQIDELVGRINGKFGNIDWAPISYQYGFVEFEPLTALYSIADIMLVTPLRDGMNLISKEFLACKEDKTGVLILSEMAGSSKELGEAIIVNPNYKEEIAAAIETAINMPREVQIKKNTTMQQRLQRYNVVRWARDFISTMDEINNEQNNTGNIISDSFTKKMLTDYNTAEKRILFIDYDGTLIPYKYDPLTAVPEEKIINMLKRFTKKDNLDVVLVSGRDKKILDQWFGKLNIQIIAEHGAWIKTNKGWEMLKPLSAAWKPQIKAILEIYTDRLPGSFIEEKEFSLAWHYRKSEPELAKLRRRELTDQLLNLTANKELQVLKGHKVVEIRSVGINKGLAGLKILSENNYDFVAAIGDDWTDEDLFNILPLSAYTIMVGHSHSSAKCRIEDFTKVIEFLNKLEANSVSNILIN